MELSQIWSRLDWPHILSLPALEWAEAILPELDLPHPLVDQRAIWRSIYTQAVAEYQELRSAQVDLSGAERDRVEALLRYRLVAQSLGRLGQALGGEVAEQWERWMHFHFFNPEAAAALRSWALVLSYAYPVEPDHPTGQRKRPQVPPPAGLHQHLPQVQDWLSPHRREDWVTQIKQSAPPPPPQIPYEQLEQSYEATLLSQALTQALTFRSLRFLAQHLTLDQQNELLSWAAEQHRAISAKYGPDRIRNLCGHRYLRPDLPEIGSASVLLEGEDNSRET